jgi:hypothetical protein
MKRYLLFDSGSGAALQEVVCPESMAELQAREGVVVLEAPAWASDANAYFDGNAVRQKQPLSLTLAQTTISANGTDEAVISGIPAGTTVEWPDGQIDEVTDGEARFSVDLPGTYTLIFDAVPYLRQEVTIEAVAAT